MLKSISLLFTLVIISCSGEDGMHLASNATSAEGESLNDARIALREKEKRIWTGLRRYFPGIQLSSSSTQMQLDDDNGLLYAYQSFKFRNPTQNIHVSYVNLRNERVGLEFTPVPTLKPQPVMYGHLKTTSAFAKSVGAHIAVNGGFWKPGNIWPDSLYMAKGKVWPNPSPDKKQSKNGLSRDFPFLHEMVCWPGNRCIIPPHRSMLDQDPQGNWLLTRCKDNDDCEAYSPEDVIQRFEEPLQNVINGNALLVDDGREGTFDDYVAGKIRADCAGANPRTMIGLSGFYEGQPQTGKENAFLILAVADGRNMGGATGLNYCQMAPLMHGAGAYDAINIDGGGSTAMFINGQVVNSPSDQPERAVPTHLGVTMQSLGQLIDW